MGWRLFFFSFCRPNGYHRFRHGGQSYMINRLISRAHNIDNNRVFFPKSITTSLLGDFGPRVCPGIVCFFSLSLSIIHVSLFPQNGCKPDAAKSHILLLYVCTSMKHHLCTYIVCILRVYDARFSLRFVSANKLFAQHIWRRCLRVTCVRTGHGALTGY